MTNGRRKLTMALCWAITAVWCGRGLAQQIMTNTLPAQYVYPLSATNSAQPGFIWNISQVANTEPGSIAWAESQLAGEQGANLIDPNAQYSATGPGTVPGNLTLPISFIVPDVINFDIVGNSGSTACSHNRADLPCETGMIGTPGTTVSTVNFAAEVLTYLALPSGLVTMGVRSDDGFQVQIGAANPGDRYSTNAMVPQASPSAGLFLNGTRGAGDTIVTFNVPQAGLYAARLLYFQGGGDASVEWYTFPPAGGTNSVLAGPNTGTNAVLVGDVANGGIAAYRSINHAPLGSYVSSFLPSPGMAGVATLPTITATLVNGSVPVSGITLSVDGTIVAATITTTGTGASVSYTATTPLGNTPHVAVLTWTDNGAKLSVASSFATQPYIGLDPSQRVTVDTSKPGFRFNVFANTSDPLVSSVSGVQGGESDNLDNIELGLNGLLPDGFGGFLVNNISLSTVGVAAGPAPALGGPKAPAHFIITNTLDFTSANMPGWPPNDGGTDPSHSEVLTYVSLPVGLTTFTLTADGFYRVFVGSWDYLNGVMAATANTALPADGSTAFSVYASQAGYYPLRLTCLNLDGAPQASLYTMGTHGTNVLVNDIANGGLPAYYAVSGPNKPYVRYASPRPVLRQVEYPNNRVLLRLQDGSVGVNDASPVFNLDGKNVTVTKNRVGDVLELTWTATTLQTPAEIHSGLLTYQDTASDSLTNQWKFLNLKAIWLPTAVAGYWVPTNAVTVETFAEYTDPTVFTNDTPTGNWILSPQPSNPLVDIAPVWTHTPTGPTSWYVWNWDALETCAAATTYDLTANCSLSYANWLAVDLDTFANLEGSSKNTAPGEMINGVPLIQLVYDTTANVFVAESDCRNGNAPGQTQFAISKRFDLTGVTNPVLAFASIQKQNQDDINAMEYSVDGGLTWAPVIYYLDGHKFGSDPADVQINLDNTVNVNSTLFHDTNPGEVPVWTDSSTNVNNTYASGIAAPISQALAPFFAPRVNDDNFDGKRIEVVRLPLAAHKSNVRLRLAQIGTCSWYWGVSQIAFYDVPPSGAKVPTGLPSDLALPILSISAKAGQVTLTWTGTGTLQSSPSVSGAGVNWQTVIPAPTGNSYSAPIGAGSLYYRLLAQ